MGARGDIKYRKCQINRAILQALLEYGTGSLDDILAHPRWRLIKPSRQEMVDATADLEGYNYIETFVPGDYEQYRLTASGRKQIQQDDKLDTNIWGAQAG